MNEEKFQTISTGSAFSWALIVALGDEVASQLQYPLNSFAHQLRICENESQGARA